MTQISYGTTFMNGYAIIKMRAKLTAAQRINLQQRYPSLGYHVTQKGLTMIEGILPQAQSMGFSTELKLSIARSKVRVLLDNIDTLNHQQALINDMSML